MSNKIRYDKISDIKHMRRMTGLLGKLGIKCLIRSYDTGPFNGPKIVTHYGLGLKETKDLVERMFVYQTDEKRITSFRTN